MTIFARMIGSTLVTAALCVPAAPLGGPGDGLVADGAAVDAGAETIRGGGFELRGERVDVDISALTGGGFTLTGDLVGEERVRRTGDDNPEPVQEPDS